MITSPGERVLPKLETDEEMLRRMRVMAEYDGEACDKLLAALIKHHPEHEKPIKRASYA